jgi:cephalosporin hydroxylase
VPTRQRPAGIWKMQQLITEVRPDLIIEIGTGRAGATLFYATVLEHVNRAGRIVTVDIFPRVEAASRFPIFNKMVKVIKGHCEFPEVVTEVSRYVKKGKKVLVILDASHTKDEVLKQLKLYSGFVSPDSYIAVNDTCVYMDDDFDNGPLGAIKEFLKNNKNFEIDYSKREVFALNYVSGFLKRIR